MGRRAGFTLAEILVVMLITSILVLGIHAAYQQAYRLWARAEDSRAAWYQGRVLTEVLREELGGLYLPLRGTEDEEEATRDVEPAFQLNSDPAGAVSLSFFTLTPAWHTDAAFSRMARVRYRFERNPDTGRTLLQRWETLYASEKPIGKETATVLTETLAGFKVWVLAPESGSAESWQDSYQSDDQPPGAVRIQLRWGVPGPEDRDSPAPVLLESTIAVPCEGPLVPPDH
jgi:prepilin-type N-terminal cleavage/methylation domain-containing protein